jgi:hypothetical protein
MTPLELADALLDGEAQPLLDVTWKEFTGKLGLATMTAGTEPAAKPEDVTSGTGAVPGPSAQAA